MKCPRNGVNFIQFFGPTGGKAKFAVVLETALLSEESREGFQ